MVYRGQGDHLGHVPSAYHQRGGSVLLTRVLDVTHVQSNRQTDRHVNESGGQMDRLVRAGHRDSGAAC